MNVPDCSPVRFRVHVPSEHSYEVRVGAGIVADLGRLHRECFGSARPFVVSDERVAALHGPALRAAFADGGFAPDFLVVPEGETSKSLASFTRLVHELEQLGADRHAVLHCFGGGMVCDLGGFVASAYMRGVRYVNVPTSSIAQFDASVGGKVAVDTAAAKNLVGAFHHPSLVVSDPTLLATLSERDFRSGVAEAVKVAVIASRELFAFLQERRDAILARDTAVLTTLVAKAVQLKMELVGRDPYERDLRRPLNFGHTIGHALEAELGYRGLRHGEAVAVGMAIATAIARRRGVVAESDADAIFELLDAYELSGRVDELPIDGLVERLRCVRMIRGGRLHFVLPRRIGSVEIVDEVDRRELVEAFEDARAASGQGKWSHARAVS